MALYGSSKAALTLLTKAWSAEFGPSGVRVNAVSPGPTRTEGTEAMGDRLDQLAALARGPVRPAAPDRSPSPFAYLAGRRGHFVHGADSPRRGRTARVLSVERALAAWDVRRPP